VTSITPMVDMTESSIPRTGNPRLMGRNLVLGEGSVSGIC
jgi:hypothetical protein